MYDRSYQKKNKCIIKVDDIEVIKDFYFNKNNANKLYLHVDYNSVYYGYVVNGEIVSMLSVNNNRIHSMLTLDNHRKNGYMAELLSYVVKILINKNIKTIKTCAMESSKNIFLANGFIIEKVVKTKNFISYYMKKEIFKNGSM